MKQQRKISTFFAAKSGTKSHPSAARRDAGVGSGQKAPGPSTTSPASPQAKKKKTGAGTGPASSQPGCAAKESGTPISVPKIVPDASRAAKAHGKLLAAGYSDGSGGSSVGNCDLAEGGGKTGGGGRDGGEEAKKKLTPLEQQVVVLKAAHPGTLLMVEVGYKFRMFGDDAEVGAQVANLYCHPDHNFLTASFPVYRLPIYLRRLTQAGHRVGVVRQVETAAIKATSANRSAPFERKVTAVYTSATLEAGLRAEKLGDGDGVENFQEVDTSFSQGGRLTKYLMCVAEQPSDKPAPASNDIIELDIDSLAGSSGSDQPPPPTPTTRLSDVAPQVGVLAVETSTGDIQWGMCTTGCVQSELEAALLSIAPSELLVVGPLPAATRKLLSSYAAASPGCRMEEAGLYGDGDGDGDDYFVKAGQAGSSTAGTEGGQVGKKRTRKESGTGVQPKQPPSIQALRNKLKDFFSSTQSSATQSSATMSPEAVLGLPVAVQQAIAAAIDHLSMFGQQHVLRMGVLGGSTGSTASGTSGWRMLSSQQEMSLTANTIRQLEIMETSDTGRVQGSLLHLLDRSRTAFGGRVLQQWVSRPLTDITLITQRQDAVEELSLAGDCGPLSHLPGVLRNMPDIERGVTRMLHRTASPSECVGTVQALMKVPERLVVRLCPETGNAVPASSDGVASELLRSLLAAVTSAEVLNVCKDILSVIHTKHAMKNNYEEMFQSADRFPEVFKCRRDVEAALQHLEGLLPSIALRLGVRAVSYISIQHQADWLIEVPLEKEKLVPKDWTKVCSTKKVHRYHPPEVKHGVQQLMVSRERLKACCATSWTRFLSDFGAHYHTCKASVTALAHLDALLALASVARTPGYCRPNFVPTQQASTEGDLEAEGQAPSSQGQAPSSQGQAPHSGAILVLQGARHPMLEAQLVGRGEQAVPNDLQLQWSGQRVAIITGPNMGGKSCFIRTAALAVIMAQLGSFVPAEQLTLSVFDGVYTRMGASDNLLMGRSTFMEELGDASDIIQRSTHRSLVIMDELGRGTATHDGVAIATATVHYFVSKCLSLFVTHYPEVAEMKDVYSKHVGVHHMSYLKDDIVLQSDSPAPPPAGEGPCAMDVDCSTGGGTAGSTEIQLTAGKPSEEEDSSVEVVEVVEVVDITEGGGPSLSRGDPSGTGVMSSPKCDKESDKENKSSGQENSLAEGSATAGVVADDTNSATRMAKLAASLANKGTESAGAERQPGDGNASLAAATAATTSSAGFGPGEGRTERPPTRAPKITFLYKLVEGAADASFGLNVARMAGLPEAVVERAGAKAVQLQEKGTAERQAHVARRKLAVAISKIVAGIKGNQTADAKSACIQQLQKEAETVVAELV